MELLSLGVAVSSSKGHQRISATTLGWWVCSGMKWYWPIYILWNFLAALLILNNYFQYVPQREKKTTHGKHWWYWDLQFQLSNCPIRLGWIQGHPPFVETTMLYRILARVHLSWFFNFLDILGMHLKIKIIQIGHNWFLTTDQWHAWVFGLYGT